MLCFMPAQSKHQVQVSKVALEADMDFSPSLGVTGSVTQASYFFLEVPS